MKTENVSTLRIHKLSHEQFLREQSAEALVPGELYLTPDEDTAKISLPINENNEVDNGTTGDFAVSDGAGGVIWLNPTELSTDSRVFVATYDETTYEEVKAAYDSGKIVIVVYDNNLFFLTDAATLIDGFSFVCLMAGTRLSRVFIKKIVLQKGIGWSGNFNKSSLEYTSNMTQVIDENSENIQYPSAKAVYDFVMANGSGSEDNKIFMAVFGETSYEDVAAAIAAGKAVFAYENGDLYTYSTTVSFSGWIRFENQHTSELNYLLLKENGWSKGTYYRHFVQFIDETSTDEQYPSAKAVLNFVRSGTSTTPELESAQLGDELIRSSGWTTTGWTGSFATGFTHTSGNTNPLVFAMPEATGTNLYQVTFEVDNPLESMQLFVTVGNSAQFDTYGYDGNTIGLGIQSVEDGNLQFIPDKNYTGTIRNISIKRIEAPFDGIETVRDSDGNVVYEMRPTTAGKSNLFAGANVGQFNTSGFGNLGFGSEALAHNTSGFWNTALGYKTLEANTAGSRNIAIGYGSLLRNKVGHRNIGIGTHSLINNTTGNWNIAIGADSQDNNTTGSHNVAIGFATLYKGTEAYDNVAVGSSALNRNETGFGNVAIGKNALYNQTWHQQNTAVGFQAGMGCKGSYGVYIGCNTGLNEFTGNRNILIGFQVNVSSSSASDELNIGNLLKGSLANDKKHLFIDGGLNLSALPTSEPDTVGMVWNDNGTLKIKTVVNLIEYPFESTTKTVNGVEFTDNGDGTITVNGTATATAEFRLKTGMLIPTGAKMDRIEGSTNSTYEIQAYENKSGGKTITTTATGTNVADGEFTALVRIMVRTGYTANNLVLRPVIYV